MLFYRVFEDLVFASLMFDDDEQSLRCKMARFNVNQVLEHLKAVLKLRQEQMYNSSPL